MAANPNPYGGGNANPYGPGGTRRVIKTGSSGGGKPPPRKCCPTGMAVASLRRGKYRLARRYAAMAVRLIAARIV